MGQSWLVTLCVMLHGSAMGVFVNHDIPINDMYIDGDLVIGGLISTRRSLTNSICGGDIFGSYIQITQGIKFAIAEINRDPNILPNITLGFANLDYCSRSSIALARSTSFLPRARACKLNTCGQHPTNWTVDMDETGIPNYDVIGVIGTAGSTSSQMVTGLLEVSLSITCFSLFYLPIVSIGNWVKSGCDKQFVL